MPDLYRVVARNFVQESERVIGQDLTRPDADALLASTRPLSGELLAVVPMPKPRKARAVKLLTGTYGRLTILHPTRREGSKQYYLCECRCNPDEPQPEPPNTKEALGSHLTDGSVQSCGCMAREAGRKALEAMSDRKRKAAARKGGRSNKPGRIEAKKMEAAHAARRVVIPENILKAASRRQEKGETFRELAEKLGYPPATLAKKVKAWREARSG